MATFTTFPVGVMQHDRAGKRKEQPTACRGSTEEKFHSLPSRFQQSQALKRAQRTNQTQKPFFLQNDILSV